MMKASDWLRPATNQKPVFIILAPDWLLPATNQEPV